MLVIENSKKEDTADYICRADDSTKDAGMLRVIVLEGGYKRPKGFDTLRDHFFHVQTKLNYASMPILEEIDHLQRSLHILKPIMQLPISVL